MACLPHELRHIPLFALLDDDEIAVLAAQVEIRTFPPRHRIFRIGEPGRAAYILLSGAVTVSVVDDAHQDITLDQPRPGEFFGFASMLEQVPHQTNATTTAECVCVELDRFDISVLISKKPMAGMDMLTVLARQMHAAQELVRGGTSTNPNEVIEDEATFGERLADRVARFGGSWTFIIAFGVTLSVYTAINILLRGRAWDPYPFILLNLFLSMLASIQAPVIMMSQNRQDHKDRVRSELDFEVNVRAESEIQALARKLNLLQDKLDDHEHLIRELPRTTSGPGTA